MTLLLRTTIPAPTTADVSVLRRSLIGAAAAATSQGRLDDVELVAAELIANAVVHGRGPVTVELINHPPSALRIRVTDAAYNRLPTLRAAEGLGESGQGLRVVAAICETWGCEVDADAGTKTTWADIRLTA